MIINQGILDIAEVKKKSTYIKENVSVGRKRLQSILFILMENIS